MTAERVQKVLSRAGVASRRQVETWIKEGRLSINKKTAELGDKIDANDRVYLDGRQIKIKFQRNDETRVLLINKPVGVICSRDDPDHKKTIFKYLPKIRSGRWVMVGRLDLNTSGLLMFTDNGALAHRLMHPSSNLRRGYQVRVFGDLSEETMNKLRDGVELEDGFAKFEKLVPIKKESGLNQWFYVEVSEGRNRLIRRLWEACDVQVSRLVRTRYGPITFSKNMPPGHHEELSVKDVKSLMKVVKMQ